MSVRTEKDLPDSQRATWLKAMSAMELRNYGYAIQLLQGVLKAAPDFLPARQLLRKASVQKNAGKKGMFSGTSFSAMKVQGMVKKDPVAAMDAIEKVLETDPYNAQANQILKEAALAAKMPEVAEFALETIVAGNPKDTKTMHELAKLLMELSLPKKAVEIYSKIVEITPHDLAAVKGAKDAAAAESMQRGGWEREDADYRSLMKNKEEAAKLEQASRVVRSEDAIDNLLGELHAKAQSEPENVDTARKIAELYEQKEDLENAIAWYQYAADLTRGSDFAIVRKVSDLRLKSFDTAIQAREEYIAASPDSEESKAYAIELEDLKRQRGEMRLEEAKKRVERNPTDLQLRFELGDVYVAIGNYKDAIPELQKARQNPNARLRAMNLLGKCFVERGMFDLAAKTLEDAAADLFQMDSTKKDIVYNLGLVYEKMGNSSKSIDCMKQIYEVDYGYRDVAERVEGSYAA